VDLVVTVAQEGTMTVVAEVTWAGIKDDGRVSSGKRAWSVLANAMGFYDDLRRGD